MRPTHCVLCAETALHGASSQALAPQTSSWVSLGWRAPSASYVLPVMLSFFRPTKPLSPASSSFGWRLRQRSLLARGSLYFWFSSIVSSLRSGSTAATRRLSPTSVSQFSARPAPCILPSPTATCVWCPPDECRSEITFSTCL